MAKKKKMNVWDWLAALLLIISGLAWLLYGYFGEFNLVMYITFNVKVLAIMVYTLVGIASVYSLIRLFFR